MLLLLRKVKHSLFERGQFRKYLTYAVGEIVLVIIGILIALQIDNWNDDKQRDEILNNYLEIIADNIEHDLKEISDLRTMRESAYDYASRSRYFGRRDGTYTVSEIEFANEALNLAKNEQNFNLTNSGFEALKSSGFLEQLRGNEIEALLYDYYDTADRVLRYEQKHNRYISELWLGILSRWPVNLDLWTVADPSLVTMRTFEDSQPLLEKLFDHPTTWALFRRAESTGDLILEYERLDILGNALLAILLNNQSPDYRDDRLKRLDELIDPRSPYGYPKVITDGQIAIHSFYPGIDDSISYNARDNGVSRTASNLLSVSSFEKANDALIITYGGGASWAGWWYLVGNDIAKADYRDFSQFNTLSVELKGEKGGEKIYLNIEDFDDPRDGTSTRVPLELTNEWRIFEIDLKEFTTADLSKIRSVGFIITDPNSVTFSVKKLHFITN